MKAIDRNNRGDDLLGIDYWPLLDGVPTKLIAQLSARGLSKLLIDAGKLQATFPKYVVLVCKHRPGN